jgi:LysR family transcriptional regulator, transcriptional activator of nhaA
MVLADSLINPALNIRAYNHPLGESGISFFAVPALADQLRDDFPNSLNSIGMLMQGELLCHLP